MVSFEFLAIVLSVLGLAASITYYAIILNNANKTQRMQLETRQTQMFMQIYNQFQSSDLRKARRIIMTHQWQDLDSFSGLFDPQIPENLENYDALSTIISFYEGIGALVKEGFLDIRWVALLMAGATLSLWEKIAPTANDIREQINQPRWASEWEYLYDQLVKYIKEHPELAT